MLTCTLKGPVIAARGLMAIDTRRCSLGHDLLTTQFYRLGHPQNPSDFLFRRLAPSEQRRVSMAIRPRAASPLPTFETDIDLVIGG